MLMACCEGFQYSAKWMTCLNLYAAAAVAAAAAAVSAAAAAVAAAAAEAMKRPSRRVPNVEDPAEI